MASSLDWRYLGPFRSSAPAKWKIDRKLTEIGGSSPQILMGVASQILDQISKITPISDLLHYKGFLSVKRLRTFGGEKKEKEKIFC